MSSTTEYIVIACSIILILVHIYFQGATCRIKKDLTGQIVIITGSNAGIGYETALNLAKTNATIILACRD